MDSDLTVTTERFSADIEAKRYIARFRDADRFIGFCRQCGYFGRRHGCPPFDHDTLSDIAGYARVRILGAKIVPSDKSLPLAAVNDLMLPVITSMNAELLEMEKSLGGRAFGFVGKCIYCGDKPCARIDGKPCRHPDKVRPSLEAYGFDIVRTASELLGVDIKWSDGKHVPDYLTLVCGVFY